MISSIESNIRSDVGGNVNHRLRDAGYIPAVIYGKKINTLPIQVNKTDLDSLLRQGEDKSLIELNIGGETYTTYIKEIQRNPVTKQIIHLDFQQVKADEKIHVSIPVILRGKAFVEKSGVVVQQQLKELEIECSAGNIPKKIEFDITHFKPGDILKIADMEFGEELSVVDELQSVVASIATIKNTIDDEGEVPLEEKIEPNDRH
ncbi:LSU ribosomal protein L25P [Natronincola peptidivorans]|uniref:Large ribosomal subunit protein bL25 n=1 Tax=Natronincola peptidivorans TaxID=426128 RepID=A0A1I0GYU7_9FIRM|nr:50S ribosomal protein L25 [Natronincola peptidivorans]SET75527.1 LSU ribosomal protein L25P [Natronincola peptidivorans]